MHHRRHVGRRHPPSAQGAALRGLPASLRGPSGGRHFAALTGNAVPPPRSYTVGWPGSTVGTARYVPGLGRQLVSSDDAITENARARASRSLDLARFSPSGRSQKDL